MSRRPPVEPDATPAPGYTPDYAVRARELTARGAGESDLAAALGVSVWAVKLWRTVHEEFAKAIKMGHERADDRVTMALYERAIGYTFEAVKPMVVDKELQMVEHREHVPPDVGAAKFWLTNRRPDLWREKTDVVVNKEDVRQLSDAELTKIIRASGTGGGAGDASEANGAKKPDRVH